MAEQIPTSLEYPLNALGVDPTAAVNEAKSTAAALKEKVSSVASTIANSDITDRAKRVASDVKDRAARLPEASRKVAGQVDRHARENPWLHIGAVSIGFFALGLFVGRQLSKE